MLDRIERTVIRGANGDAIEPFAAVHEMDIPLVQHGLDVDRVHGQVQRIVWDGLVRTALDGPL
ncbi:MAG: hypothetical protein IPI72_00040 [Flavobacteriales bacterium]|nr:hypothetical protein [Flavobacteriales bacterium]